MFAVGMGLFFSPNQAGVMNSLPPDQRGAGAGMLNTFQNSASVLSMGLFFTIVTLGLAARLPGHLYRGLTAAGVAPQAAHTVANEPPIGSLFSAFLGFNPIKQLLGPTGALEQLPAHQVAYITGRSFFPKLIEQPFAGGLHLAFTFAFFATAIAIVASAVRGRAYFHVTEPVLDELADGAAEAGGLAGLEPVTPGGRPVRSQHGQTAAAPGQRVSRNTAAGVRAARPQADPAAAGEPGAQQPTRGRPGPRGRQPRPCRADGGRPGCGRAAAGHQRGGRPGRGVRPGAALLPADRPAGPGPHHARRHAPVLGRRPHPGGADP